MELLFGDATGLDSCKAFLILLPVGHERLVAAAALLPAEARADVAAGMSLLIKQPGAVFQSVVPGQDEPLAAVLAAAP